MSNSGQTLTISYACVVVGKEELFEPLFRGLEDPGMSDLVLGGLQRKPVQHRLRTVFGGIPHARQDELGEAGQAHRTALRLCKQREQFEEGSTQLGVLGNRGEEHADDLGGQALIPTAEGVD